VFKVFLLLQTGNTVIVDAYNKCSFR